MPKVIERDVRVACVLQPERDKKESMVAYITDSLTVLLNAVHALNLPERSAVGVWVRGGAKVSDTIGDAR